MTFSVDSSENIRTESTSMLSSGNRSRSVTIRLRLEPISQRPDQPAMAAPLLKIRTEPAKYGRAKDSRAQKGAAGASIAENTNRKSDKLFFNATTIRLSTRARTMTAGPSFMNSVSSGAASSVRRTKPRAERLDLSSVISSRRSLASPVTE